MILSARGDLFYLEPEKNLVRNLTLTPGINERNPVWSPDGMWYAYISDASGEDQIYIQKCGGSHGPTQITHIDESRMKNLKWSPDGKKIGFADKRAAYYYVEIESKIVRKVFFDPNLGSVPFVTASWSPDSNWLVYSRGKPELVQLDPLCIHWRRAAPTGSRMNIAHSSEPQFDPDGRYLYWIADCRIHVEDSYWDGNHHRINPGKIVAATLQDDGLSPNSTGPGKQADPSRSNRSPCGLMSRGWAKGSWPCPSRIRATETLVALKGRLIYFSEPANGEPAIKMYDMAERRNPSS